VKLIWFAEELIWFKDELTIDCGQVVKLSVPARVFLWGPITYNSELHKRFSSQDFDDENPSTY
jgi:hypothetical protein